ncbi:uncharacterized protein PSFLO_04403 [Pseudozyma flocculosa]|uniref:Reverse transcriptase Ty1/copia-type domain-containing protein n=1 Tax=Pseudozyma flocculosa TaxID=84751 RepID=A0A5C3F344_9BASI|nr:uncharacterized protein PSFLO_04403 [Pseudozyma flocculosa]
MSTLRLLLIIALQLKMTVIPMDVVTAFLNGDINCKLFMHQALGQSSRDDKVCQLNKALYGLKQAGRTWYEKASDVFDKMDFEQSDYDPALFL